MKDAYNEGLMARVAGLLDSRGIAPHGFKALAEEIGVSRMTVARWYAGTSVPRWGHVCRLTEYFKVPLDYFMIKACDCKQ